MFINQKTDLAMSIVVPGEVISREPGFLRGHGTFIVTHNPNQEEADDEHGGAAAMQTDDAADGPALVSCATGSVERVNKLISVRPVKGRYTPEVGDLVVGRIVEVGSKRWKVELGARQLGVLSLSSVNLPSGAQRMRTHADALQVPLRPC